MNRQMSNVNCAIPLITGTNFTSLMHKRQVNKCRTREKKSAEPHLPLFCKAQLLHGMNVLSFCFYQSFPKIQILQALVAKQKERKGKNSVIYETRSVSFHLD